MSDISMTFQKISDRPINIIQCELFIENDCKFSEGEYQLRITSFIGSLNLDNQNSDTDLIIECIENDFDKKNIEDDALYAITLKESGEWEDVFWHKYYVIEKIYKLEF